MAEPLVQLTPRECRALLSRGELLARASEPALDALGRAAELLQFDEGHAIVRQGSEAEAMFVIVSGAAEVLLESPAPAELGRLGAGAFFGELALLTDEPRTATVRAVAPLLALRIPRRAVREVLAAHEDLAQEVWTVVARRRIRALLASSPRFAGQPEESRRLLAGELLPVLLKAGQRHQVRATGSLFVVAGQVEVESELGWMSLRGPSLLPALGPLPCRAASEAVLAVGPPLHGLNAD